MAVDTAVYIYMKVGKLTNIYTDKMCVCGKHTVAHGDGRDFFACKALGNFIFRHKNGLL